MTGMTNWNAEHEYYVHYEQEENVDKKLKCPECKHDMEKHKAVPAINGYMEPDECMFCNVKNCNCRHFKIDGWPK